jgi:hypothetical protein
VVLEVEEHLLAAVHELAHEPGTGLGEELAAHLEHPHGPREPVDENVGLVRGGDVEGDDQAVLRRQAGCALERPG